MAESIRAHILISGRVQGVSFRAKAQKVAQEFGVSGWIQNLSDGRVEAVIEGREDKVEQMIEWAKRGPFLAKVDNIDIEWQEYKGEFNNFDFKRT